MLNGEARRLDTPYMFRSEMNADQRVIVWSWSGHVLPDDDFKQASQAMREFSDELRRAPAGPVLHVNIVGSECRPPTSAQRKALAGLRRGHSSTPYYFFYVTRSPIARGVMTAVSWMQGNPPFFRLRSVASVAAVIAWVAKEEPAWVDCLRLLVNKQ